MNLQKKHVTLFNWGFFILLLSYAILRAWFVAPLHDEAATYFHYIETGKIFGGGVLLDANNHLLNSWCGRFFYDLFGAHFFLFRIPALICFCIYFWSARKLTEILKAGIWGDLCFLALNTIPWIFDYFSYTRGYGMAIGFFMAALFQLHIWLNNKKTLRLFLLLLLLYLAVLSNLTYLVISLIILGCVVFLNIVSFKRTGLKNLVFQLILSGIFLFALKPLIKFTFDLKNAGALYYGSLDGLWWVTGKTFSRYVLFFDSDWLRILYVLIGIIGCAILFLQWKKESWLKFVSSPAFWLSALLGMNLLAILFLAKVMQVNYPEDRAAMYLVPLSILALTALFSSNKTTKYSLVVLLFFPITFLLKLNLNTSVFSPDERMTEQFYLEATKGLKPNETVCLYPTMGLTYSFFEQNNRSRPVKHIATLQKDFLPFSDLILTKTTYLFEKDDWSAYKVIAQDPASDYIALKRKKDFQKTLLLDTTGSNQQTNAEYLSLYNGKIGKNWRNKAVQINIAFDIATREELNDFEIVVATNDSANQNFRYDYQNLRWYYTKKNHRFSVNYPYSAKQFQDGESQLIIYIWNQERKLVKLTNPEIQIIELK